MHTEFSGNKTQNGTRNPTYLAAFCWHVIVGNICGNTCSSHFFTLLDFDEIMRIFKMSKNVKKGTKCLINSSKLINMKKWEEHMLPHMLPTITCQQSAAKCLCFLVLSYISTPLVLQLTVHTGFHEIFLKKNILIYPSVYLSKSPS